MLLPCLGSWTEGERVTTLQCLQALAPEGGDAQLASRCPWLGSSPHLVAGWGSSHFSLVHLPLFSWLLVLIRAHLPSVVTMLPAATEPAPSLSCHSPILTWTSGASWPCTSSHTCQDFWGLCGDWRAQPGLRMDFRVLHSPVARALGGTMCSSSSGYTQPPDHCSSHSSGLYTSSP